MWLLNFVTKNKETTKEKTTILSWAGAAIVLTSQKSWLLGTPYLPIAVSVLGLLCLVAFTSFSLLCSLINLKYTVSQVLDDCICAIYASQIWSSIYGKEITRKNSAQPGIFKINTEVHQQNHFRVLVTFKFFWTTRGVRASLCALLLILGDQSYCSRRINGQARAQYRSIGPTENDST